MNVLILIHIFVTIACFSACTAQYLWHCYPPFRRRAEQCRNSRKKTKHENGTGNRNTGAAAAHPSGQDGCEAANKNAADNGAAAQENGIGNPGDAAAAHPSGQDGSKTGKKDDSTTGAAAQENRAGTRDDRDTDDLNEESRFDPVVFIRLLMIPMFISLFLFFIPMSNGPGENNNVVSSFFDAIIRSGQTFSLDASIQDSWETVDQVYVGFNNFERCWIAFILTLAPLMTFVSAATLFRIPRFWFIMLFSGKKICIFSDLNERAKMYAAVLQQADAETGGKEEKKKRIKKPYIVFCSDGKVDTVDNSDIAAQSLVLKREICDIHLARKARKRTSFYLVAPDNNTLIELAGKLKKKYDRYACRIYCVSSGDLNEYAIDMLNKDQKKKDTDSEHKTTASDAGQSETNKEEEKILFTNGKLSSESEELADKIQQSYIEIISEPVRVVYHMLYDRNPETCFISGEYLTNVLKINDGSAMKTVNVLVLGAGTVGEELARTMLWYCQLPGIGVSVTIADNENTQTILSRVFKKNMEYLLQCQKEGLAAGGRVSVYKGRASLEVKGEKDLLSMDLENLLYSNSISTKEDADRFHFIFVATGDDNRNHQLALRIRRYYLRNPNAWGCPKVYAVIWNRTLNRIIGKDSYIPLHGTGDNYYDLHKDEADFYNGSCPVSLIGDMADTVRPKEELVYDALRYHSYYYGNEIENLRSERDGTLGIPLSHYRSFYQNSESDERSNWAVAIHGILKYRWYKNYNPDGQTTKEEEAKEEAKKEILSESEQIRWYIYKLLEGDAPVPPKKLELYVENSKKGRDTDPIRGYHAALRSWADLKRMEEEEKKDNSANEKYWCRYAFVSNTKKPTDLALAIEEEWENRNTSENAADRSMKKEEQ